MKKICKICQKEIDEIAQDYYKIQGFHLGKRDGVLFYHKTCFDEKIKAKQMNTMVAANAMDFINKAKEKFLTA